MADLNGGRIYALELLNTESGKALLAQKYASVIDNVEARMISTELKNKDLSGDIDAGSVEAKRFVNSASAIYGTAAANGLGTAMKLKPVNVPIDVHREIIEPLEKYDAKRIGVPDLIARRTRNHAQTMARELERAFFNCAYAASTAFTTSETSIEEIVEGLIQTIETIKNSFVDGVPRDMITLVCSPKFYGKLRNKLDNIYSTDVTASQQDVFAFHGVKTKSSVYLPEGVSCIAMVEGAVAQPVSSDVYTARELPLTNRWSLELFYDYGTKAVMPDLIYAYAPASLTVDVNIGASTDLLGKVVGDLQSGIVIDGNAISGTSKYVTGYTGYSGVTAEQSGNYLALHVTSDSGAVIKCQMPESDHPDRIVTLDADGLVIIRLTGNQQTIVFTSTVSGNTVRKIFNVAELVLTPAS